MPQETERTLRLELQDEVAVCLVFAQALPLVLQHYLGFENALLRMASDKTIEVMASMIQDDPKKFRTCAFEFIETLAQVPNKLGRRGVSMEAAIAAFKGDGSCPDGVDPENWESLVQ
jgi:hypothetical protein